MLASYIQYMYKNCLLSALPLKNQNYLLTCQGKREMLNTEIIITWRAFYVNKNRITVKKKERRMKVQSRQRRLE